jgi:O-antigen/teichoic acid export membrane protein
MVMRLLFGAFFVAAAPLVAILAGAQVVSALCGSNGITLFMTGNERVAMWITAVSSVTALALEVVLGKLFGVNGVAIGAASGMAVSNIAGAIFVRARLGILTFASFGVAWAWLTHLRSGRSATT